MGCDSIYIDGGKSFTRKKGYTFKPVTVSITNTVNSSYDFSLDTFTAFLTRKGEDTKAFEFTLLTSYPQAGTAQFILKMSKEETSELLYEDYEIKIDRELPNGDVFPWVKYDVSFV